MIACIQISTGILFEARALITTPGELKAAVSAQRSIPLNDLQEVEKTQAEVTAILASQGPPAPTQDEYEQFCKDALTGAGQRIDMLKLFRAKMISDEAYRLGLLPGALTALQRQAIRDRIAAIYKTLS